ncbi:PadR family transcriptional regulator [Actinoplanes awajinensis]|uniref:PadR family transcriptional regulator n=1 Tax=Actinoplanes awajinensis subsp. mycoplanecinus TaxID=135947 RepID=A0A0X3US07_9ACTN|nr:PadR family transcriptional regulator [Actinoplanes awajinensis]KUL35280.1 PadR family transcriptional regulator [Actinoplanes awajinensis subsp. mycoplanecinus]
MTHDPQLLKGVLSLLLLHLLAERESYGYEVVQRLQAAGFEDVLEGSVYPALNRLHREGLVATRLVPSPNGPARKYYRLSDDGQRALTDSTSAWDRHVAGVQAVLSRPLGPIPSSDGGR